MTNVTITLDDETAAWVRAHAAQSGVSVSRMIGEMLRRRMREVSEYEEAMRRFLAKRPISLGRARKRYAARAALHDRTRLR
jgi:hypothetical protein